MNNRLTPEQRFQIVKTYFENRSSVRATRRALVRFYDRNNRPSESLIKKTLTRFRTKFTLIDSNHVRRKTVRTQQTIAAVRQSVEEDGKTSIRKRSQQLNLCYSTTWKILHKDLSFSAYKIQLVQQLKPNDNQLRMSFVQWAEEKLVNDPQFANKIIFSDEAHFWLNGYVNKQNCRIWSDENPEEFVEKPLHPEKLTVWCGLWAGGIIGPYFFRDDDGRNVTVSGDRYREMLRNFLLPELQNINIEDMWFQQDGATCHTARETINLLKESFGERLISRYGPVNWPPRSCDISPLDFFLWGYIKSRVYKNNPTTLEELEENIRTVIAEIQQDLLQKVCTNWTTRLQYVRINQGGHMPQIIFKK